MKLIHTKKNKGLYGDTHKAFTLVEVIITLVILALIFTSVMSVFIYYSTLGNRVEANRLLQSNVKTVVEQITKDIKNNRITLGGVASDGSSIEGHNFGVDEIYANDTDNLYVGGNKYFLGRRSPTNPNDYISAEKEFCDYSEAGDALSDIQNNCSIIKSTGTENIALTNSWVSVKNLRFEVSSSTVSKVTMSYEIGIAYGKGLKTNLLQSSYFPVQATISEKLIDQ